MENTTVAFRLSPQQERVWSQQQQDGTAHSYRVQCDILLQGEVDAGRLRQSLQTVVERHEILRTVFRRRPGVKFPFQVILDESQPGWQEFDWRQLGREEQDSRLRDLQQARAQANFDFEHGPLLQAEFVTLSSSRRLLTLTAPALCLDSKSLQNLAAEIARSYGGSVSESDEVMQYADFVEWQHELLEAEDTKAGRDYWRDYCRSLDLSSLSAIVLPGATAEGSGEFEVASAPVSLGVEYGDLDSVASKYGASAPDILSACFQILLVRLTGHSDVILGRSFDGRRHEELRDALGAFSKCLPIRFQFQPGASVGELVTQVAQATEQASKWQETFTFQQVEAAAADLRFLPYGFEYEEGGGKVEEGGVGFEVVRGYGCTERFRVKLRCVTGEKGLSAELQYDRKSYEPGAMARLAGQYQTLLQAAVKNAQQAAGELPLLTAAEREQMLVEWNQTASPLRPQWVPQWFEQQAERWPERVAVVCGEQQLSYGELNARANRLAHCLRGQGVGPEMLVGLCVERSVEQMVAVLAIMKAGGAYVPLSADHPKARLQQQMAGLKVLLTETAALAQLPAFEGAVLCMDRDGERWAAESEQNPAAEITAETLVYVLYTSGSTGAPKGVAITHGNLANYTQFICQRLQLEKFPQGLQFATVSTLAADLGNTCIYPALVSGGTLHLIGYEVATDSRRMSAYAERHPIDVLKIVPSHLEALLASAEGAAIVPRQYLILGGELLRPRLLEQVRAKGGSCQILNHYGPTETTVGSLTLWLEREWTATPEAASVPIGRPIANTRVYILDGQRQPVPVGVAGELYIAGAGVARGYVNRPDWTGERFLADPFSSAPNSVAGDRMYRTGDLARYLGNGQVEFLGRNDDQVKVRGFRIELGEIEAALREHGSVRQVAVLARDDGRGGEKRLVAYVVAERAQPVSSEQLRQHLRQRLPEHMLPAAIALLDKLPLTANGKLDRQALPDPEQTTQRDYVAPRTATEEVIAAIWAEVLERDRISRDDNFFDLGGHSLLATQVISRLRRAFAVDLPLRSLFDSPSVAGLAREIDDARRDVEGIALPPLVRVPRDRALPLSFAQQRLWFLDQLRPNDPLYNIARAVRITGSLDLTILERSINEIVRRHESQRTTFAEIDGQAAQIIAPELRIPLLLTDLTSTPENQREESARQLMAAEAQQPFNLNTGPLLRARIVRLGREDHMLFMTMHHIVSDAWSAGVLFHELTALYDSFATGRPSPLPELTIQYADYAVWQRQALQGDALEKQMAYWRKHLAGAPPLLDLPVDRPRPATRDFRGSCHYATLPQDLADELRALTRHEGATLFMTLLAAYGILLRNYAGQDHIVVGTDLANRTSVETERLIGFFINLLPLRTDLSGDPTFRELLGRVRETSLGAYAHQDMPFDKLVEELQPTRNLSYNPLVQVLFVMQNIPPSRLTATGLQVAPLDAGVTHSKFDLAVFVSAKEEALGAYWVYSTELFEEATILRMIGHYENLLRSIVAQPDSRISALTFLTAAEQEQLELARKQRRESQRLKLKKLEPKAVSLSPGKSGGA